MWFTFYDMNPYLDQNEKYKNFKNLINIYIGIFKIILS